MKERDQNVQKSVLLLKELCNTSAKTLATEDLLNENPRTPHENEAQDMNLWSKAVDLYMTHPLTH